MTTCRICLKDFNKIKFHTEHIAVCGRCVNTLNESPEPAREAELRLAEMLARGMRRNAERDLAAEEEWKRRKAQRTLDQFDEALDAVLPGWINKFLAKPENSRGDFKIMRAHRRGLLRMEGFTAYPSSSVWKETAHRIRIRDEMRCTVCGATETTLDVHHIVYLSKHGTNQQSNLITLCRSCHELEHERAFDLGEIRHAEPESISIQAGGAKYTNSSSARQAEQPSASAAVLARTAILQSGSSSNNQSSKRDIRSLGSISSASHEVERRQTTVVRVQNLSPIRAESLHLCRPLVEQKQSSSKIVRKLFLLVALIAVIVSVLWATHQDTASSLDEGRRPESGVLRGHRPGFRFAASRLQAGWVRFARTGPGWRDIPA